MANWSDTYITLTANKDENIKKAYKEIEKYKEDGYLSFEEHPNSEEFGWSCLSDANTSLDDGTIVIRGSGRWAGPYGFIKWLVDEYSLNGTYKDLESGCNFYHKMEFYEGSVSLDEEYEYFSVESLQDWNDSEYWIEEAQYRSDKENVKSVMFGAGFDEDEVEEAIANMEEA